jgi:hypothetical protein
MRVTSRLSSSLICSVAAVSLVLAYYQTRADTRSLHHELERHALVLAESIAKSVEPLVESNSYHELQRLVDRFKDREQIAGIAVYSASGELLAISSGLAGRLDQMPAPVLREPATSADSGNGEVAEGTDRKGGGRAPLIPSPTIFGHPPNC